MATSNTSTKYFLFIQLVTIIIVIVGCSSPVNSKYIPMELDFEIGNASEFGKNDGYINSSITGGISPYTFLWSTGQTTQNISNLAAGSYIVTVTDNKNNTVTDSARIAQPDYINVPPIINSLISSSDVVNPGTSVTITADVTDVDDDVINYTWSIGNSVLESGPSINTLNWQSPNTTGQYFITLTVNDGTNERTKTITIRVNSIQNVPTLVNPINNSTTKTGDILLTWECIDADNDRLSFNVYFGESSNPPIISYYQSEQYYDPGILEDGKAYYWRIDAEDNYSNVTTSDVNSFVVSYSVEQIFQIGNSQENIKMVLINGGSFPLGAPNEVGAGSDEVPVKTITIDYDFWIGKFEVTQKQWKSVYDNWISPSSTSENHPATNISFNDVTAFIDSLNKIENDSLWRLPSEAEWEYVCRADHYNTRFWWGDDNNYLQLTNYAWYNVNSSLVKEVGSVRTNKPNPWGVWDMQGNAYEYCEDYYHYDYNTVPTDGSPELLPDNGSRAMRGGSVGFEARRCRPSLRSWMQPTWKTDDVGFRLVRDVK